MRAWPIGVSLAGHALLALTLPVTVPARPPPPTDLSEVTLVEVQVGEPVIAPAIEPPASPEEAAPAPSAPAGGPTRRPERADPAPSPPSASLRGGGGVPGPDVSRSLGMRGGGATAEPSGDDGPALPRGAGGSVLRPWQDDVRADALARGAPVVGDIFGGPPAGPPGEPALGREVGGGRYRKDRPAFVARVDRDGRVHFDDKPNWQGEFFMDPREGVGYRATFDVTDWLMRMHGEDPYWAAKYRYLEDTRAQRDELALAARDERSREAIRALPELLDAIWTDPRTDARLRRAVLFHLWDEVLEDGAADLVRAGEMARATILAFVRERLPAASPDAYTVDELQRLNAGRESKAVFAPYERGSEGE